MAELAQKPNLNLQIRHEVCNQLRLAKDAEAADLLAMMAWEVEYPQIGEGEKEWQGHCIGALGIIYQGADSDLKSHIANLFDSHQVNCPTFSNQRPLQYFPR